MEKAGRVLLLSLVWWLWAGVGAVRAAPPVSELRRYVLEVPRRSYQGIATSWLRSQLDKEVGEFVAGGNWGRFCFVAGKASCRIYHTDRMFTVEVLARSLPFLSSERQAAVRSYLSGDLVFVKGDEGVGREFFQLGPKTASKSYKERYEFADRLKLYSLWVYAYYTGDWQYVEDNWGRIESLGRSLSTSSADNLEVASLIGYARLADKMAALGVASQQEAEGAIDRAAEGLRNRLVFEENNRPTEWYAEGRGFLNTAWNGGSSISRWREMREEVGRALWENERSLVEEQEEFADTVLSSQVYLFGLAVGRAEQASTIPVTRRDVFLAQAFLFNKPGEFVAGLVDAAECRADPFHVERLAVALERLGRIEAWEDHKEGPFWPSFDEEPSPTEGPVAGDVNGDGRVDGADVWAVLRAWLGGGTASNNYREDVNADGKVNGIDFGGVVRNWGG